MITLSMFSIIYLLPFIHVLFLFFGSDIIILRQNQKYLIILCVFSIFLFIVYFILFLYEKTEYLLNGFMALLPLILTLSWYIFERGKKYNKEIIFSIIINYFLFFFKLCSCLFYSVYSFGDKRIYRNYSLHWDNYIINSIYCSCCIKS